MVLLDHKNNSQQTNKHRNTSDSCALATRGALWSYPTGCTLYHPALDTYITAWICAVFSYSPDKKCSVHWACLIHSVRFNKHDICLYSQLHKDSKSPEYKQDSVCLDTSAFCNASSTMLSVTADVLTGTWGVGHVLCGTAKKWYRSATAKHRLVLFLRVATVSWPRTIISDHLL